MMHIEEEELNREMQVAEVSMRSRVLYENESEHFVEELDQGFTTTGMPVLMSGQESARAMVKRLSRMERLISTTMKEFIFSLKQAEKDIAQEEEELERRKQALKESREGVNILRTDMVRMQISVEDIESQRRHLTMSYTPVDVRTAGRKGFEMSMEGSVACFQAPKGPVLLLTQAQQVPKGRMRRKLRWRIRVTGNASWAVGIIPEEHVDNPMFFFTDLTCGVNSIETTRSSQLPREKMHGLWVEIVCDPEMKTVAYRFEGRMKMETRQTFNYKKEVRIAVCAFLNCYVEVCTA